MRNLPPEATGPVQKSTRRVFEPGAVMVASGGAVCASCLEPVRARLTTELARRTGSAEPCRRAQRLQRVQPGRGRDACYGRQQSHLECWTRQSLIPPRRVLAEGLFKLCQQLLSGL